MPLIGARPRHVAFISVRQLGPSKPIMLLRYIIRGIRRAASGRPSSLVSTASLNYDLGRIVLSEFLETEEGAPFVQRLRRLAVEDSDGVNRSVRYAFILSGVVALLGIGFLLALLATFAVSLFEWSWTQATVIVGLLGFYGYFVLDGLGRSVSVRAPVLRWMLAVWLTGLAGSVVFLGPEAVFFAWMKRSLTLYEQISVGFTLLLIVNLATLAAAAIAEKSINAMMDRMLLRQRPVSTAIFELIWSAFILQAGGGEAISAYREWQAIDALGYAARAVGIGLSRLVPIDDLVTRAAIRRRLVASSHALRGLGPDIVLGDAAARSRVSTQLSDAVVAVLVQSYASLPTMSDEQERARQQELLTAIRRRSARVAWQLAIGALPVVVVLSLRLTPLELPPETASVLTSLAVGWLLVKVLSAIDPGYRETLADARALASEVRGGSSGTG